MSLYFDANIDWLWSIAGQRSTEMLFDVMQWFQLTFTYCCKWFPTVINVLEMTICCEEYVLLKLSQKKNKKKQNGRLYSPHKEQLLLNFWNLAKRQHNLTTLKHISTFKCAQLLNLHLLISIFRYYLRMMQNLDLQSIVDMRV